MCRSRVHNIAALGPAGGTLAAGGLLVAAERLSAGTVEDAADRVTLPVNCSCIDRMERTIAVAAAVTRIEDGHTSAAAVAVAYHSLGGKHRNLDSEDIGLVFGRRG